MFLNESELTERRAFIESFVKIVVMSGQSRGALRDSDAGRQPNTKERRRGGGLNGSVLSVVKFGGRNRLARSCLLKGRGGMMREALPNRLAERRGWLCQGR